MTRIINASLYVPSFTQVGVGEYTFELATYNNQADSGNAAYDVQIGFLLYVPAVDINTSYPIPGIVHRYIITDVTIVDPYTISGSMRWDELGPEEDIPANSVYCLLSEPTPHLKLGLPPSDQVYPDLTPGTSLGSLLTDLRNIVDLIEYLKSRTFTKKFLESDWVDNSDGTFSLSITHTLGVPNLLICFWRQVGTFQEMIPLFPTLVDDNTFKVDVMASAIFDGQVTVAVSASPV